MKKFALVICILCLVCGKMFAQYEQDYKPTTLSLSMSYCPVNEAYDGIAMDVTLKKLHLQYQQIRLLVGR